MPQTVDPWKGTFEGMELYTNTLRSLRMEQKEEKRYQEELEMKKAGEKRAEERLGLEKKRTGIAERSADLAEKRETRLEEEAETREQTTKWQTLMTLMGVADKSGGDEGARNAVSAYWKFAGFDKMPGMPKSIKYQGKRGDEWRFIVEDGKLIAVSEKKLTDSGGNLQEASRIIQIGKTAQQKIKDAADAVYAKEKAKLKAHAEAPPVSGKIGATKERLVSKVLSKGMGSLSQNEKDALELITGEKNKLVEEAIDFIKRDELRRHEFLEADQEAQVKILKKIVDTFKTTREELNFKEETPVPGPKPGAGSRKLKKVPGGGYVYGEDETPAPKKVDEEEDISVFEKLNKWRRRNLE
jgi:hypothetical protein